MSLVVRLWRNNITTTFLAGLVLLLPVVLTVIIMAWIIDFLKGALGPGSILGNLIKTGGSTIIGPGYDTLAFFLGILIAILGIWFLGIIARSAAQKSIERSIDRIFTKLPIFRTIYNPVSRVVRLATDKTAGDFSGMTVVSCRLGGANGVDVLALLANQEVYLIGGERRKMVYLPCAPIPMSGGLVMVSEDAIVPVPEMKVDDLLRIYFSLGALAPETMQKAVRTPKIPPPAAPPSIPRERDAERDLVLSRDAAE